MKNNHNGATPTNPLKGVRALLIRKNSPAELLLNRLREYLLYSKLRSLLPSQPFEVKRLKEIPMEYEPAPHEIPGRDSDDENTSGPAEASRAEDSSQSQGEDFDYALESDEEKEKNSGPGKTFIPSIKIKKLDSTLLISTVVLKDVALSSALFRLLEEEKLDIVYENQYRTETKVVHTIQVNLPSEGLDIDDLEQKLQAWAARRT
ncbi:uncharacterized protein LOC131225738 [Magnolia sinica]|uniref:uncharacterized protein LOC131225738 n=1 Tax=Magnolia sinica TaxID=86752 RepID=UPI00265B566F|nr:uncharacterized protein LOC131225738 [Magnolia sinica]